MSAFSKRIWLTVPAVASVMPWQNACCVMVIAWP